MRRGIGDPIRHRARRASGPRSADRLRGFTFIELMLVLILIGILFSFAAPRFEGLTPEYRLRTAARTLATKIESHRLLAMTKGTWLGIRYTIDEDTYYELVRPPPPDYPRQPLSERLSYKPEKLPSGVRIRSVQVRGSSELFDAGTVLVSFSPSGTCGSHTVTLEGSEGRTWAVEFNAITGTIDFVSPEEAGFDDFEG